MAVNSKLFNYLMLAKNSGSADKAFAFLLRALQFSNTLEEKGKVYRELLPIYFEREDYKKVSDLIYELKKNGVEISTTHYFQGLLMENTGKYRKAESEYMSAIQSDPSNSAPYYSLGCLYDQLGYSDRALGYYIKYVERLRDEGYDDPSALNDIALIYLDRVNPKKAKYYLDESLRADPSFFSAHYSYGVYWEEVGDDDNALEEYKKAVILNKKFVPAYLNQANIYMWRDDYHNALKTLDEGLSENYNSDLFYRRAACRIKMGDEAGATEDLREAINISPALITEASKNKDFEKIDFTKFF